MESPENSDQENMTNIDSIEKQTNKQASRQTNKHVLCYELFTKQVYAAEPSIHSLTKNLSGLLPERNLPCE